MTLRDSTAYQSFERGVIPVRRLGRRVTIKIWAAFFLLKSLNIKHYCDELNFISPKICMLRSYSQCFRRGSLWR